MYTCHRIALVLVSVSLASIFGCPRSTPAPPDAGDPCVHSTPNTHPPEWRCSGDDDCEDHSQCSLDTCEAKTGRCVFTAIPDGGCDQLGTYATCVGTSCCPREAASSIPAGN